MFIADCILKKKTIFKIQGSTVEPAEVDTISAEAC